MELLTLRVTTHQLAICGQDESGPDLVTVHGFCFFGDASYRVIFYVYTLRNGHSFRVRGLEVPAANHSVSF
jgi:hypothetical protein